MKRTQSVLSDLEASVPFCVSHFNKWNTKLIHWVCLSIPNIYFST